ncbi:MAG TPA: GH92 family glycosyl hydrolase [Bacteroidia bacterium]|nr:GH92 family glycosyl hydrolase [Bacteroidia bacterium]
MSSFRPVRRQFVFALISSVPLIFSAQVKSEAASFVNPFIGTGGHGHTFPGAVVPFGMVQLSPDTRVDGSWDGCSGYHYSDKKIYGFSHTHLSGTGCSDWGDILLLPYTGTTSMNNAEYASHFSHASEMAEPGYYTVKLDKYNVKVELSVTPRVGIHRYKYKRGEDKQILIDLLHRDKTLECDLQQKDSITFVGYRISEAWARRQILYFAVRFSKPVKSYQIASNKNLLMPGALGNSRSEGATINFGNSPGEELLVKVAISQVSTEGALKNLDNEAPHWDFDLYRQNARKAWNEQLSKVKIEEDKPDTKTVFYTALYHCFIHPSLSMDVDGQYLGRDLKVHKAEGFTVYSVYSLWDTYRALHPLFTLLEADRTNDFIQSFLQQYTQSGRLPMWELSANETDCMIGFHAVSVITDAYMKGIRNYNIDLAYEAMKAASNYTAYGIPIFNKQGYLQIDDENESVSKSLEYAYDNWCIATLAQRLDKNEEAIYYYRRAWAYINFFDSTSGHLRPRKNGAWLKPFFPEEINNHFTEGNSWQYSFYVPQDVEGLMALHGGKKAFEQKLDELFTASSKTRGREQADVTGLIGQYAHGNEPSHHMAYLYNHCGAPQKTIAYTRRICKDFYRNAPDGLIGNEDCGQMSAWYVFTAMGLYPLCPGTGFYELGTPLFKSLDLSLLNHRQLKISSDNTAMNVPDVVMVNGKPSFRTFLRHEELLATNEIAFKAWVSGSLNYGSETVPPVFVLPEGKKMLAAPIIESPGRVFRDKATVSMHLINSDKAKIQYTISTADGLVSEQIYKSPFEIRNTATLSARAKADDGTESGLSVCRLNKIKNNYTADIHARVNSQYAAEGTQTLFDGIYGDWNWRKGDWLGYQGQDVPVVIDLLDKKNLSRVGINCLQDRGSWIFFPKAVEVYISDDNKAFQLAGTVYCPEDLMRRDIQTYTYALDFKTPRQARYVKLLLKNAGKLPDWHPGAGGDSFIFLDEVEID